MTIKEEVYVYIIFKNCYIHFWGVVGPTNLITDLLLAGDSKARTRIHASNYSYLKNIIYF